MSLRVKLGNCKGVKGVKKGGAGGRFTFGKPGDELNIPNDLPGDPNYIDDVLNYNLFRMMNIM